MNDERRAQARYPRHVASVRTARIFVRRVTREWGLDGVEHDVVLIVSELVSNAIVHTRSARARDEVGVSLDLSPARLRIEVQDNGEESPVCMAGGTGSEDESGRGLGIVGALASSWGVSEGAVGKVVWAEVSGKGPVDVGPEAPAGGVLS